MRIIDDLTCCSTQRRPCEQGSPARITARKRSCAPAAGAQSPCGAPSGSGSRQKPASAPARPPASAPAFAISSRLRQQSRPDEHTITTHNDHDMPATTVLIQIVAGEPQSVGRAREGGAAGRTEEAALLLDVADGGRLPHLLLQVRDLLPQLKTPMSCQSDHSSPAAAAATAQGRREGGGRGYREGGGHLDVPIHHK